MTLNEFLERLKKTPRKWRLMPGESSSETVIRYAGPDYFEDCQCPIEKVFGLEPGTVGLVAPVKGLQSATKDRIIRAADGNPREPELRKRLLDACGLKEAK